MSTRQVYAIRDGATNCFHNPFFCQTSQEMVRMVRHALTEESLMAKYPQDYSVFHLGSLDIESGELKPLAGGIECVVNCDQLVAAKNEVSDG